LKFSIFFEKAFVRRVNRRLAETRPRSQKSLRGWLNHVAALRDVIARLKRLAASRSRCTPTASRIT
jgi:hypothetical protein